MSVLHTPGPWVATSSAQILAVLADRYICCVGDSEAQADEVDQANARLIAAAPELLEALESLVKAVDDYRSNDAMDDARAAIAKAKGVQS